MSAPRGIAGRLAGLFVDNRLTPLLIGATLLLGLGALTVTPREEEPQIAVPMVDVQVADPGASPAEVEQRVTAPVERALWEIPGVEYLYSTSARGGAIFIVRFKVGEETDRALVRVHAKLAELRDRLPPGLPDPVAKARTIDDVPILAVTLWSERRSTGELSQLAETLRQRLGDEPGVGAIRIIGATRREISVAPDPSRLAARGIPLEAVAGALRAAGARVRPGDLPGRTADTPVWLEATPASAEELGRVVIGAAGGKPVRVSDVATVRDGDAEAEAQVLFGRPRARGDEPSGQFPAVTLTFAKRPGVNATELARALERRLEGLRPSLLPGDVRPAYVRNYGESAAEKSGELIKHLWLATLSVVLLIGFALGWREAGVVAIAIPVTLAMTLLIYYLTGYTLNRVTLFALIFAIGILVDDAIVVVENVARHLSLGGGAGLKERIVAAVDEVGSPTILATWAVIAAILPLAFVGGLMGPYMRPIPVGASLAMLFSLAVAFVITPWAAARILKPAKGGHAHAAAEGFLDRLYHRVMARLLDRPRWRAAFLAGVALLLLLAVGLIPLKAVKVKMLPFDNKSELELVVNLPEGTPLEATLQAAQALARAAGESEEVENYQIYAGAGAPVTFNGLVRHYDLRAGGAMAEVQLNLRPRGERREQSHPYAARLRERLAPLAQKLGARLQVVEVPPGPPVLATLVAEVYGPDYPGQVALAGRVRELFRATPGVVDVDWYMEATRAQTRLAVDRDKAALSGVSPEAPARALALALGGVEAGEIRPASGAPVPVRVRLAPGDRSRYSRLAALPVAGAAGTVPLGELVRAETAPVERPIYHKNLRPVVYVTADVSGGEESPVYAIARLNRGLAALKGDDGRALDVRTVRPPADGAWGVKWDGEWQITYEVFRDMGIAFAAVMVLIFALIVGWFGSYKTPLVIMAPIPLTLVGILPVHALMGAFFTATSMIGFIVGAGIIVRNSIILVDFIELRRAEGLPLRDAVIEAGAVRFRPMLLTAAAVVAGSFVILFDPIFQGLAVALMAGEVASTLLSRLAVPVLYYLAHRGSERTAASAPPAALTLPELASTACPVPTEGDPS